MSRPIKLGVLRDSLKESEDTIGSLNYVFTRLIDANPDAEKLQTYILSANFYQPAEPPSLFGTPYKMYVGERIESKFLLFIAGYRDSFIFSADVLGWVRNPPADKLDALVPDTWPHALGRTFREYCGQCDAVGDDVYYSMHTFWEGAKKDPYAPKNDSAAEKEVELFYSIERFGARPTDPSEIEFWLFYDYFGKNSVVLDYEKPKANE